MEELPQVDAWSKAGFGTWITVTYGKRIKFMFDCGRFEPDHAAIQHVFISHGHLDHCSGAFMHARVRGMMKIRGIPTYYVPVEAMEGFKEAKRAFEKLDSTNHEALDMNIVGVRPGDEIPVCNGFKVIVCESEHRVPSVGYGIVREKKQMKPEYATLTGEEKRRLFTDKSITDKDQFYETHSWIDFAYTGDTVIKPLETCHVYRNARVLCCELSFLDDSVSEDTAKEKGHIHLRQLSRLYKEQQTDGGAFVHFPKQEQLVLVHFSGRHQISQIMDHLWEGFPQGMHHRILPMLDSFDIVSHVMPSYQCAKNLKQFADSFNHPDLKCASMVAWNCKLGTSRSIRLLGELHPCLFVKPLMKEQTIWLGLLLLASADDAIILLPATANRENTKLIMLPRQDCLPDLPENFDFLLMFSSRPIGGFLPTYHHSQDHVYIYELKFMI